MMRHGQLFFYLAFWSLGIFPVSLPAAAQDAVQTVSPSEAATVSEFITACDRNVSQCEYKMRSAALNKINTRDATPICFNDVRPQAQVIAWLKAHPETYKMPTEDGLYTAYKSLYPCP